MPIELQSKLLRFLQDRRFSPLGSTRVVEADVRIIAATSRVALDTGKHFRRRCWGASARSRSCCRRCANGSRTCRRLCAYFLRDMTDGRSVRARRLQGAHAARLAAQRSGAAEGGDPGRGAEPQHPDHRIRASAEPRSPPGSSTRARTSARTRWSIPSRGPRTARHRRPAWCAKSSPPPPPRACGGRRRRARSWSARSASATEASPRWRAASSASTRWSGGSFNATGSTRAHTDRSRAPQRVPATLRDGLRRVKPGSVHTKEREHLMGTAKVVLRQGRARPLWFGHPWVYANGVARVEGDPAPGDVVALCDHDGRFIGQRLLQPALADPRPALHPGRRAGRRRLLPRPDRPRPRRARPSRPAVGADERLPPRQQRGGRSAGAGGRRLRRRRGRADHHARDLRPAQRDLRRAGGGAREQDDLRDLARLLRRAGGVRRRLARRARRAAHAA